MLLALLPNLGFAGGDGEVSPPVVETPKKHAGKSRRRYAVKIDGQDFIVTSVEEAEQLLRLALDRAERHAEMEAKREVVKRRRRKRPPINIEIPKPIIGTRSPELAPVVNRYKAEILKVYQSVERTAEIRELMRIRERNKRDEEAILLLIL